MENNTNNINSIIKTIDMKHLKKKYTRIKEDKHQETLNIIAQLKNVNYPKNSKSIRELIKICNNYVYEDNTYDFIIPFPEIEKKIIGYLPIDKREKCVVLLRDINSENNNL